MSLLADRSFKKVTVTKFCQLVGISRSSFYWAYPDINYLCVDVIVHEFEVRFNEKRQKEATLSKRIYEYLEYLQENALFYQNLSKQVQTGGCQCRSIKNAVYRALAREAQIEESLQVRSLRIIANNIYVIVRDWIRHRCRNMDIHDIYRAVILQLRQEKWVNL
ncbi:hypothetical protein LCB40_13740 [Lactobacillus corticis]|uniref:HTH tetR-type domain-containing protein n=2 Tax=Lactobacillus corticis TaxID=2201249 RepID=A0A916VJA1_9LACO|nr:hypothetical protein LCB40_13740 [Lactobacillus corticis]